MQPVSKRIAVIMQRLTGYQHGVQLGIAEYFVQRPNWVWTHIQPETRTFDQIDTLPMDGIIALVDPSYADRIKARNLPTVDVANWVEPSEFPRILPDDKAVAEMAARYLMDLGLRQFAAIGHGFASFSSLRVHTFEAAIRAAGLSVSVWQPPPDGDPITGIRAGIDGEVMTWLRNLPKPLGLFCATDRAAMDVLSICRYAGIKVPEQVCVLGVDNDELFQRISRPPLSSIALHTEKIGFEAARLLDQLMNGAQPPQSAILFPPKGVMARQSTNLLAIADQDVLEAVRYIRMHLHQHLTVRDLLRVVPVNRRFLERKFREHLGRTPLQEIRRARIETAKQLLADTDLSMPAVAKRSGFPNPERLANVFHAMVGATPTHYRRKFRLQDT